VLTADGTGQRETITVRIETKARRIMSETESTASLQRAAQSRAARSRAARSRAAQSPAAENRAAESRRGRGGRRVAGGILVIAAAGAAASLAGCARPTASGPPLQIGTANVGEPDSAGTTDAYLVITNNGPADRLVSVSSSAGGQVMLRGPQTRVSDSASGVGMRTVPDIRIPADQTLRLAPNGFHLLIVDSRPMKAGRLITLKLVFARAGTIKVPAEVTNPESGGSSYFIN
jgi:copper(I)-binding protein